MPEIRHRIKPATTIDKCILTIPSFKIVISIIPNQNVGLIGSINPVIVNTANYSFHIVDVIEVYLVSIIGSDFVQVQINLCTQQAGATGCLKGIETMTSIPDSRITNRECFYPILSQYRYRTEK